MRAIWLRQAAIMVALTVLPALGQAIYFKDKISWRSSIPASEMVKVDQARSWGDVAIWVDARPEEEFTRDHVPGAILLNEDRWDALLPQLLSAWTPEKKIIVYCSSIGCNASREVAKKLREKVQLKDSAGQNCVFVLEGGWEGWLKGR
ncbi:MAG: rhodanese-like domain-containing protein [Verrucomicrobiota bacterium]